MRIEKIKSTYDVNVRFVHFPLHPDTPAAGKTLEQLFNIDNGEVQKKNAHMKGLMDAEGLPYGVRTHTYNSRLAQELAAWAVTQPGGDAIHNALFGAYFVDCRNIAEVDVLLDVAASINLDVESAREVLQNRVFKVSVDADWSMSRQYGVTGVPTYVAGQQGVVGVQPYEVLEQLVKQALAGS